MRRQTWRQPATQRTSYFWSAGNAQKDSWQTIHPRDYFVFPREGNEISDLYAGMHLKYKPVYPAHAASPAQPYFPASRLAVINPTLSMPDKRMISMALATWANSTASSPLTKATFSARSLKTSDSRGPSESQVASSSLIFSFPVSRI